MELDAIMNQEKLLIVEDEENERTGLAELASLWGFKCETACDGVEALEKIESWSPTIVVTDLMMPRMDGMELLRRVAGLPQECKVIVMTAHGSVDNAVEAMKIGAYDYIQKGGLLMWPILVCSIIAIAVFLERLFYFHRATIHVGEFLKGLSNLIQRRNFAEALHESAGTPGPVARVIHAAIIRHDAPRTELRDIVQEAGQLEVPKLERFLGVLATVAFLAPLLGLLGTVAGMIFYTQRTAEPAEHS